MDSDSSGLCEVCGKPGPIHVTEIRGGTKTIRSLCDEHAPPEMCILASFRPRRTAAEELASLRKELNDADRFDPEFREGYKDMLKLIIAGIEAGHWPPDDEV